MTFTLPEPLAFVLGIVIVVLDIVIRVLSLIFVPRNRRPQTALAWLLLIWFQPYIGIVLFCGSLYLWVLGGPHGLVYVTPVGGLLFMAGWVALVWSQLRSDR